VVKDFEDDLQLTKGATWYTDQWIEQNISKVADHLDAIVEIDGADSIGRRELILTRATQKIESGTLSLAVTSTGSTNGTKIRPLDSWTCYEMIS
jgi:hypothetical protein